MTMTKMRNAPKYKERRSHPTKGKGRPKGGRGRGGVCGRWVGE